MRKEILRSTSTKKSELLLDETIFSQSNGTIGIRGTYAEGYGTNFEHNQTLMNGFYDMYDYHYEENFSGFPQKGQKLVQLPDTQKIYIYINDKKVDLSSCELLNSKRKYNLDQGIVTRETIYQYGPNQLVTIREIRLVSLVYEELFISQLEIETNFKANCKIISYLDMGNRTSNLEEDPRISKHHLLPIVDRILDKKQYQQMDIKTKYSNCSAKIVVFHDQFMNITLDNERVIYEKEWKLKANHSYKITKYGLYFRNQNEAEIEQKYKEIVSLNLSDLIKIQTEYLQAFWNRADIVFHNDKIINDMIRYNMYQLNANASKTKHLGIAAKGLSGEGYDGHYFWDTEIYMIPFFTITDPQKAKQLLLYRYHTLDMAKDEAKQLGYSCGAKFPWRTINGTEASSYYPGGSAQYHINSDIAYSIDYYFNMTNDLQFMVDYGFEIMLETARFLICNLHKKDGKYHLDGVTGPDEYTAFVNDNYYTNAMLQHHLNVIVSFYKKYAKQLKQKLCDETEIKHFAEIAEHIELPYDSEKHIVAQDSEFLNKKILDIANIPKDKFPLLLHYHPMYLYKHQVLKQADALLALILLNNRHIELLENTYDYYEPITTHDSSLSKCAHAIALFKMNRIEEGLKFFKDVVIMDFENKMKNTEHGLHMANLAGSYLAFMHGIIGLEVHEDYIKLNPLKLSDFTTYEANIMYRNSNIHIAVGEQIKIVCEKPTKMMIGDTLYHVKEEMIY